MSHDRWQSVRTERGKPRVYIQQFLDLRLPEAEYKKLVESLGLSKPFEEETATRVMEAYLEDLDDGSQCDAVHFQRSEEEGLVVVMTVVSYPFRQESFDRLTAAFLAKKALSGE